MASPKTYVLAGYDTDGSFKYATAIYSADPNVIVLKAQEGESIDKVAKKIEPPANVILLAHGDDNGTPRFLWNNKKSSDVNYQSSLVSYSELLGALPRNGILSITIGSCKAGTIDDKNILSAAPPGTLVQAAVGPQNDLFNVHSYRVAHASTTENDTRPVDFFLDALGAFHTQEYQKAIEGYDKKPQNLNYQENPDPNFAMPHILGIGGKNPMLIDLDQEIKNIGDGKTDAEAMKRAVNRVLISFDATSSSASDAKKIHRNISEVESQLLKGEPLLKNADSRRIGLAIAAAYLDESGELQKKIEIVKTQSKEPQDVSQTLACDIIKDLGLENHPAFQDAIKSLAGFIFGIGNTQNSFFTPNLQTVGKNNNRGWSR